MVEIFNYDDVIFLLFMLYYVVGVLWVFGVLFWFVIGC